MSRVLRFLLVAALSALLLTQAAIATAAPVAWENINVTLHADQQQSVMLIWGDLPENAPLPAEAELAVPTGMQIAWLGEILGGPVEQDPEVKYTKSTRDGMDIYKFTLTKSRTAQIEGALPGVTSFDGTKYVSTLKWTAWTDLSSVRISQRIPQTAVVVDAAPGATLQPGGDGSNYYTKVAQKVKAGQVLDLPFSYKLQPTAAAGAAASGGSSTTIGVIAVIAVGFCMVLLLAMRRKRPSEVALDATEDDDDTAHEADDTAPDAPDTEEDATAAPKRAPRTVLLMVVAVVIAGAFGIAAATTKPQAVNGKFSKNFGSASACAASTLQLAPAQGVDLAKDGAKVVDVFEGAGGIGEVTLDVQANTLYVAYCSSSESQDSVVQKVAGSGLVQVVGAQPADPPGTIQGGSPAPAPATDSAQ